MDINYKGCANGFIQLAIVIACLFAYAGIGLWLYNSIMVTVFCWPTLTYWQMFGLMWLARLFFGRNGRNWKVDAE